MQAHWSYDVTCFDWLMSRALIDHCHALWSYYVTPSVWVTLWALLSDVTRLIIIKTLACDFRQQWPVPWRELSSVLSSFLIFKGWVRGPPNIFQEENRVNGYMRVASWASSHLIQSPAWYYFARSLTRSENQLSADTAPVILEMSL